MLNLFKSTRSFISIAFATDMKGASQHFPVQVSLRIMNGQHEATKIVEFNESKI